MVQMEIILRGVDRASAVVKQVESQTTQSMEHAAEAAEKAGKKTESAWNRAGKAIKVAFVAAVAAAVTAVGGLATAATTTAVNFQKDMANVATLLGPGMGERIDELGTNVKQLAQDTGKPLNDLAGGLYQVVSAFGDSADSAGILETAAKASTAGLATTTDAVNLLSAVTKGYGDTSAAAVRRASDLAFMTVKLGQTSVPELAASMGGAVPLAGTLGLKMEELFGAMATLTGVTGGTAEVSTQLKATFQALVNPSKQMADALNAIGFNSGEAAIQQLGLAGTLQKLQAQTGGNNQVLAQMFGSVEALNAVLALTGSQAENFAAKTLAMAGAAGATDEAFKIQQQTLSATMDRLKQSFSVILANLGEKLLPKLEEMAAWVMGHMPQIQAAIQNAFDRAGQAIDLVVGIINSLVATWQFLQENADVILPAIAAAVIALGVVMKGQLAAMIAGWTAQAAAAASAAAATIAALLPIVGPVLLVGAAVAGLALIWKLWGEDIKRITGEIVLWLAGIWESIKTTAVEAWEGIKAFFAEWWETLLVLFTGPLGILILLIVKNWEKIRATAIEIWTAISDWFVTWWERLVEVFRGPVERLTTFLSDAWNGIKTTFTEAFTDLVESAGNFGRRIMESLRRAIGGVRIPVPTFSITWKEGPLGVKIPDFDIGFRARTLADLIPWLAQGGIATGPVIAGLGEAGDEAILPLDRLVPLLAAAMRQVLPGGAGGTVIQRLHIDMRGAQIRDGREFGRGFLEVLEANGIRVQGV